MEIVELRLDELIPYDNNPRKNDEAVDAVALSISAFGFRVPIVIDKDNVIIAGHTRLKAAKKLGLSTVPCVRADDLTDDQVRAFRLADNKVSELAEWDFSKLEAELEAIDFDMEMFGFKAERADGDILGNYTEYEAGSLGRDFVVPPFTVLNTTTGVWKERKKQWLEQLGDLSASRDGEFGQTGGGIFQAFNGGTSNFDPVLAEVVYKWFSVDGASVLDPWGGEATKGYVAGALGYEYTAVEIRAEQVQENRSKTDKFPSVEYICGDSNKIDNLLPRGKEYDLMFTSPPYYDLEIYSTEDMSALGTYEEFIEQYARVLKQCYNRLRQDSFAVIKVGEIRDKKTGIYRNFVGDTVRVMIDAGYAYYNELVLVQPVGTAAIRARSGMVARKMTKTHQNVLVFYKGDPQNIAAKFPKIDFPEDMLEADTEGEE